MRNSTRRSYAVLHGKMDIACTRELTLPSMFRAIFASPTQTFDDHILGLVVSPPPGTEFRKYAPMLEESTALVVSLCFLTMVIPISVAMLEVCFTGQCQQGYFIQDRFHPQSPDSDMEVPNVRFFARVVKDSEGDIELLFGSKAKRG